MNFRDRKQEDVGVDLTPFLDVVFMLLLFFVVSASLFKGATQLGIQLPQANAQKLTKEKKTIEIGVDAQGGYYLDGKLVGNEPKGLKTALSARINPKAPTPVILVGDGHAPHQSIVSALEITSELGIAQVQIVAERRS